jgi:expansin (peptidoglycan-binding protein)
VYESLSLAGKMPMDKIPINWKLISHPINWATIILMVFIAAAGVDILVKGPTRTTGGN